MNATTLLLCLSILTACGASAASTPPPPPPSVDPPPAVRAAPPDFTMRVGGGPVAASWQGGTTVDQYAIEPRPGVSGEFDLVVTRGTFDDMGMDFVAPPEVRRIPIPSARVAAIHDMATTQREEFAAQCVNRDIMDGATSWVRIEMGDEVLAMGCTNASTPFYNALTDEFSGIVRDFGVD